MMQRKEYKKNRMNLDDLDQHPLQQFKKWLDEAIASNVEEPEAMCLSTCSRLGKPSSRMVLLKIVDEKGFVFFTNYRSKKAKDLDENPFASLVFYWKELERQAIIHAEAIKISTEESIEYFESRPRESQLSAWASAQDEPLTSRQELLDRFAFYRKHYENLEIPKPPHWGGYRLIPTYFEFWQGREYRLHDRFSYILKGEDWEKCRLSP